MVRSSRRGRRPLAWSDSAPVAQRLLGVSPPGRQGQYGSYALSSFQWLKSSRRMRRSLARPFMHSRCSATASATLRPRRHSRPQHESLRGLVGCEPSIRRSQRGTPHGLARCGSLTRCAPSTGHGRGGCPRRSRAEIRQPEQGVAPTRDYPEPFVSLGTATGTRATLDGTCTAPWYDVSRDRFVTQREK